MDNLQGLRNRRPGLLLSESVEPLKHRLNTVLA
jgi:hypothetical protein